VCAVRQTTIHKDYPGLILPGVELHPRLCGRKARGGFADIHGEKRWEQFWIGSERD
jgi:hypothetical protein